MELSLDLTKRYTYADYLTWIDDVRRELIDGFISLMAAPSDVHADVSSNITYHLRSYVEKSRCTCKVFYAPYDVRLPKFGETANNKIYSVVQPDICVICDQSKRDEAGYCGAPDMIVEILSKSTRRKDLHDKFLLYEQAGVQEYWIANPKTKSVTVHILQEDGTYSDGSEYVQGEQVPVHIFSDYLIDLHDIFKK